jgi:hypothetical protein
VYVGDHNHPHTVFDYTPNRSRDGPLAFLESFTGYLQADAYSGYDSLYTTVRVVEVAYRAHTRRKFHESRETDPARAHTAIAMIRLLYKVEDEAGDLSSDERKALRQERSKPRLEQIEEWLEKERITALPKSPVGQAIGYALNNWTALGASWHRHHKRRQLRLHRRRLAPRWPHRGSYHKHRTRHRGRRPTGA